MKISKLVLNNFSSFEGINEFDFSVDDKGKNIILIGGENGAGKTSLFSAIKVALYGPLAFGYVGANSHYSKKIKDYINSKAFQTEKVESSVELQISVKVEREYCNYTISRNWNYTSQKLIEDYSVKRDKKILDDQELSYFQNYLQGIIPPSLFDFFLFDGEEVGNIFSTSNYNGYVQNALFTMCDMDVFEIVRKFTSNYLSKSSEEVDDGIEKEYRNMEKDLETLEMEIEELALEIDGLKNRKEEIDLSIEELETAYKKAGGITDKQREELAEDYTNAEHIKQENTLQLKSFVEGLMPFYIVNEMADDISRQLDYEEKGEIFYYIQNRIKRESIEQALKGHGTSNEKVVDDVIKSLFDTFRPSGYSEDDDPIHDLSKEEIGRVNSVFSQLEDFDKNTILKCIDDKQKAAGRTAEINRILKESMTESEVKNFNQKENKLLKKKQKLVATLLEKESTYSTKKEGFELLSKEKDRKYQALVESVQNKHVYELSHGISSVMSNLLSQKTTSLRTKLENLVVDNLMKIYRKDNLITYVEIEENFQFNLYQNTKYKVRELLALINNLGYAEVTKQIGNKGILELKNKFGVDSLASLKAILEVSKTKDSIETYKRIELSRLSKGERQIFILSLYWSIIMISGQDIPFIIDTPYSRIDANHRKEISEKFFPNISKQVVILSTDEEINEEYYKILKPHISKEYLLTNDENANKTTVEERYFFEVK